MMISHGTATMSAGFHRSSSDFGGSFRAASTCASISTTVSFASSDGWPMRTPPTCQPALGRRCGSRAGTDDERRGKQKYRKQVRRQRDPFDEPHRRAAYPIGTEHPDAKPHHLRLVDARNCCRRIRLPRGVHHRNTEYREEERGYYERIVRYDASHQPPSVLAITRSP